MDDLAVAALRDTLLANECFLADQYEPSREAQEKALEPWREVGNRAMAGESHRRLSRLHSFAARNSEAWGAARAAVETLEAIPPGPELAQAFDHPRAAEAVRRGE